MDHKQVSEEFNQRLAQALPSSRNTLAPLGGSDAYDWFGNFTASGVASMGELVGITPSIETQRWRADNPTPGLISELLGTAIPYAGWYGATKKLKKFNDLVEGLGDMHRAPFITGAAREAARFAPFEAGRVLASQMIGDKDLGTMAGEAAVNLAIGSGVGGLFQSVASAGTRAVPLARIAPGIDVEAPRQIQQRFLQQLLDEGTALPQNVDQITYNLERLRSSSRGEVLPPLTRYVEGIEGKSLSSNYIQRLNRLFQTGKSNSGFVRKRLINTRNDFRGEGNWRKYAEDAGLPTNFEDLGQYYRAVSFTGKNAPQAAGSYNRVLTEALDDIGNGWRMGRERDDGLFVMARKLKGHPSRGGAEDQWLLFKTDQPGSFVPSQQKWMNTIIKDAAWVPEVKIASDGGEVYNTVAGAVKEFPLHNYAVLPQSREGVGKYLDALLPKQVGRQTNELLARVREGMLEYLAPAGRQFMKNPRANYIHTNARLAYDSAETMAQKLLYGSVQLKQGRSLFYSMLQGRQGALNSENSIKTILDGLNDTQIEEFWRVWREAASGETVEAMRKAGRISKETLDAVGQLEAIDNQIWESLTKAQKATGERITKRRSGHFGLSRTWQGDSRIVLRDEGNKVVAIAAGFNRRGAQARAKELKKILDEEGTPVTIAEEFQLSQMGDVPRDVKPIINRPGFVLEQQGIRGYRWDDAPFTRDELMEAYAAGVHGRLKYQANLTVDDMLAQHLAKLADEDPHGYRLVVARLNDLAGKQGPLGQIQNKIADQILAPMIGQNSASRIVGVSNSIMWTLQLGAMKLAYPVQGALTFLQTVAPEVAFITSATDNSLAGSYTYFAAGGTKGPVGSVGALDPLKLMGRGLKSLKTPSPLLAKNYARAMNDRVIDPRFVEEYVGESASKLTDVRGAIKSGGGFVQWLKALNEFLPGLSERFQRGHAFAVGHDMATSFLKMSDEEQIYRFARQFTEKTMFLYNVSDRPRLFTTPAGSFMGLFKNWMVNYMGMMAEYAGEASMGNFAPLIWQTAGTLGVGGLAATPLYLVANGFSNAFTGNSLLETMYGTIEDTQLADGLMYGLPAGLTGISLYSQTASPVANPMRDANMLFSTAHLDRMQYMSKALGGAWDHWQATGEHPANAPKFWQQMSRAVAPVVVYRTVGAAQEGMLNSLTSGYPVMEMEGLMDKFFYAAGFNPVDLDKAYAISDELWREQDARQRITASLGTAFADAQMNRDNAAMQAVLRQAYAAGLDPSSVLRSAQSRIAKMTTPMLERNFRPEDLRRFERVLGGS